MTKTIIISITTIICTLLTCYTIFQFSENNRYVSYDGFNIPSILDHKTGKIYSIKTGEYINTLIITDLISGDVNEKLIKNNSSNLNWSNVNSLTYEEYLEKVAKRY